MGPASAAFGLVILCVLAFWVGMILHRSHKAGISPPRGPELWLIFPDIGDGDCMLVRDPATDRTVLIDTGSSEQSAQQILACMHDNSIDHLNGIVLLSSRSRSVGGVPYLVSQTRIDGPVLLPSDPAAFSHHGGEAARSAIGALEQLKLHISPYSRDPRRADSFLGDDPYARVQFLSSSADSGSAISDPQAALALKIDYGASSALYTAALEPAEEDRLVANDAGDLTCDVLAVTDSGSDQAASSEFLALAAPRVAMITSSANHPPADDTLQRLHAAGAEVGQTHLLNNITLRMGRYSEEPILWSSSPQPPAPQAPATQTASSP